MLTHILQSASLEFTLVEGADKKVMKAQCRRTGSWNWYI